MKPSVLNGHYIVSEDKMNFDVPVEIHFNRFGESLHPHKNGETHPVYPISFRSSDAFKVFCNFTEPETSAWCESHEVIIENHHKYDLILTARDEILEKCRNAVFFPYGTTWLHKDVDIQDKNSIGFYHPSIDELHVGKTNSISFMTTNHRGKEGYEIRHGVWTRQGEIQNKVFYSSTRYPVSENFLPDDDKKHLFKSMFSIVVESSREENYFTEKICDALLAKTIPIYWGCPNIGDFFDVDGMIICNSVDEIMDACKRIENDSRLYEKMKDKVDLNFEKAKEYCVPLHERMGVEIQKGLDKKEAIMHDEIILSIGILTIPERRYLYLRLMNHLEKIMSDTPHLKGKVEYVVALDEKIKTVGEKRNEVLDRARGKYVCFIDDDDLVSDVYFQALVETLENHPQVDCVGFKGMYYEHGEQQMVFHHAIQNGGHWKDENGIQRRPVNHLNPVRTEFARKIRFPEKSFGEDSDYCDRLLDSGLIKSEAFIDLILYHYLFDREISATQG